MGTVLATDYGQLIVLQYLAVAAGVVPVMVRVDDGVEVDSAAGGSFIENGQDSGLPHGQVSLLASMLLRIVREAYSGGFAGSIMTASLVFSSLTR